MRHLAYTGALPGGEPVARPTESKSSDFTLSVFSFLWRSPVLKRILLPTSLLLGAVAVAQTPVSSSAQTGAATGVRVSLAQDLVRSQVQGGKTVETIVQAPKSVLPGDVLREETTVRNVSGKAVRSLLVGVPVPRGTEYTGGATPSTARWKLLFSNDGGKTYSAAPMRTVTVTENGKTTTKQVPAPINTYSHVRWAVTDLKPDETLKFAFRVRVK